MTLIFYLWQGCQKLRQIKFIYDMDQMLYMYYPGPLKLLMKTTRTAQYAALAANNSCLLAFVNSDIAAENKSVKTTRTPIALKVDCGDAPIAVSLYIATTGSTNKTKMIVVMMRPTNVSTRDRV
jgi:hypothetical protein